MTDHTLSTETSKVKELYSEGLSKYRIQRTLGLTKKQMDQITNTEQLHFTTRSEIKKRNQKMLSLRNQGWSLESIGENFEVNGKPMTKEGVRLAIQSAVRDGGSLNVCRGKSFSKENKHTLRFTTRQQEAIMLFNQEMNEKDIAKKLGVCEKTAISYLRHLPKYQQEHFKKNQPFKSKLAYEEIVALKKKGNNPAAIAELAGLSVPRILQILQMYGDYQPREKTIKKIQRVLDAKKNNIKIKDIAEQESITEGQVYRYINLATSLKTSGKI